MEPAKKRKRPKDYKQHFIAQVVKRSGICRATVEQVLPAVFDEIRYQLTEGSLCVPIESFGTFAVIDIPERTYHYTYGGRDEDRTIPPTQRLKFAPAKNLRREIFEDHRFDPTRRSFTHDPRDPALRIRKDLYYQPNRKGVWLSPVKKGNADIETEEE